MENLREAFATNFEQFSSTTVIRVFNFIRTSKFLVERLFWVVVLLAFSFGTVWNVAQTIQTFLSEPTASKVSFLANSTNGMSFSDAGFCIEIRSDILVKIYGAKIDNVIQYIKHEVEFPANLKGKLTKVHEMEDKRSAKLANFTTDRYTIIAATYHQFEQMSADLFTEDEVALLCLTTAMFVPLLQVELQSRAGRHPMSSTAVIQRLHRVYVERGTNFSELLTLTAEMMCVLLQIRLTRFRIGLYRGVTDYTGYNVCKYFALTYFGIDPLADEAICYRSADNLPSPLIFYSGYDQVMLSLHMESLYGESSSALQRIVVDLGGKYAIAQQPPIPLGLNKKQTVNVSLETMSTSVNLRRSGCWEHAHARRPRFQCSIWCLSVEARLSLCNCLSLFSQMVPRFSPLPDGLRSCASIFDEKLEHIGDERCRSAFASFNSFSNCSQTCYDRDCVSLLFASTEEVNDPSLGYLNASTVIGLRLTKFVYQKVDEYLVMDAMVLISALGGNLSLYLGASFLALIHIVVFVVKLPLEVACKRKQETKSDTPSASSTGRTNARNLEKIVDALIRDAANRAQAETQFREEMRQYIEALERRLQADRMMLWGARPLGRGAPLLRFR